MNLFVSAGEPSGDLHGSNLVRALRSQSPETRVTGFGGPKMAAAGAELLFPLTELAVMGIRRVLRHVPTFFRLADQAERIALTDLERDVAHGVDHVLAAATRDRAAPRSCAVVHHEFLDREQRRGHDASPPGPVP